MRLLRVGEAGRERPCVTTRGRHRRRRVVAGRRLRRRVPRGRRRRAAARRGCRPAPTCRWWTPTRSGSAPASRGRRRWSASASTTSTTPRSPASRCRPSRWCSSRRRTPWSARTTTCYIPRGSDEDRLGGRARRRHRRDRALPRRRRGRGRGVIAGYAVSHDVSERAFQLERGGQWVKGKSCETFNPLGPWLVTPDEVGDPQALAMPLTVNGETRQDGSTADMIFGVAPRGLVPQPVHGARARRPHQHRYAGGRRDGRQPATCAPATSPSSRSRVSAGSGSGSSPRPEPGSVRGDRPQPVARRTQVRPHRGLRVAHGTGLTASATTACSASAEEPTCWT